MRAEHFSWFLCVSYLVFFAFYLTNFYVNDDAYISFRSWENFINGGYFSYNINERVQAYTNTLWTILIGIVKLLFFGSSTDPHAYWIVSFWVSLVFSSLTFILIYRTINISTNNRSKENRFFTFSTLLVLLFSSKAFVDFTSSGLEYPLAFFILVMFFTRFFNLEHVNAKKLYGFSLLSSLALLTRLDTALLIALPYAYIYFAYTREFGLCKSILPVALGGLPLIFWEVFSLIYYGSLLPNTFYAKLSGFENKEVVLSSGYHYLFNSLIEDPITLLMVLSAIILGLIQLNLKSILVSVGLLLSCLYVIRTGGDFMGSRFFALPFIVSFLFFVNFLSLHQISRKQALLAIFAAIFSQIFLTVSPLKAPVQLLILRSTPMTYSSAFFDRPMKVMNADKFYMYFFGSSLITKFLEIKHSQNSSVETKFPLQISLVNKKFPFNEFHAVKSRQDCFDLAKKEKYVEISGGGGLHAFCKGRNYHGADVYGLSDPLLSRLRVRDPKKFIPGHNARLAPTGYLETIITGKNEIVDEDLKRYYERIRVITQSEHYFSLSRLKDIFYLNFVNATYSKAYL